MPTPRDELSRTEGCANADDAPEPHRQQQHTDSRAAGSERELRVEMVAMASRLERMAEAMARLEEREKTPA